jgi:hypothetical protein
MYGPRCAAMCCSGRTAEQVVVGDDDQRVDGLPQRFHRLRCLHADVCAPLIRQPCTARQAMLRTGLHQPAVWSTACITCSTASDPARLQFFPACRTLNSLTCQLFRFCSVVEAEWRTCRERMRPSKEKGVVRV